MPCAELQGYLRLPGPGASQVHLAVLSDAQHGDVLLAPEQTDHVFTELRKWLDSM